MSAQCDSVLMGIGAKFLALSDINGTIVVAVVGVTATITITVPGGNTFMYEIWLSDSATDPTETTHKPSGTDQTRWIGATNSSGIATLSFSNSGTSRKWYPWLILHRANIETDGVTVGV